MIETTIALIIFLFPLAYSPGPGNMFFAANGARFGFSATLPANIGYHIATWIVTAAIGFGFLSAIEYFPGVFYLIKIAGSLYVLWIGWKMIRAGTVDGLQDAKPANFADGVVLLLLNPKAYVIITLMFTQFLHTSRANEFTLIVLISTVFTLNNMLAFSIWTLAGDKLTQWFRTTDKAQTLNLLFGAILVGVAIWMLIV